MTENRHLETPDGQVFHLTVDGEVVKEKLFELEAGTELRVEGAWEAREGAEVVVVHRIGKGQEDREEDG